MRQISLAIVAVILSASAHSFGVAQPAQDVEQVFAQLHDAKTTYAAYLRLKNLAENDTAARLYLVVKLPELIPADLSQKPIWMNPIAENSVRLAGDLKIAEAVPVLVKALDNDLAKPGGPVTITSGSGLNNDPVAQALAKIGASALGPVRDRLKNNSNGQIERMRAAKILYFMNSADADQVLTLQLQSENDPVVRSLIEAGLQEHQKANSH